MIKSEQLGELQRERDKDREIVERLMKWRPVGIDRLDNCIRRGRHNPDPDVYDIIAVPFLKLRFCMDCATVFMENTYKPEGEHERG